MLVALRGHDNYTTKACGLVGNGERTANLRYILQNSMCKYTPLTGTHRSAKGWWEWVDGRVFRVHPGCFHVVTGHMGRLCSPETIWMFLCVSPADGLPPLFLNAVLLQVGAKTCPFEEKTRCTAEVRGHTDVHNARVIPAHWPSLHLYADETLLVWEGGVL